MSKIKRTSEAPWLKMWEGVESLDVEGSLWQIIGDVCQSPLSPSRIQGDPKNLPYCFHENIERVLKIPIS